MVATIAAGLVWPSLEPSPSGEPSGSAISPAPVRRGGASCAQFRDRLQSVVAAISILILSAIAAIAW